MNNWVWFEESIAHIKEVDVETNFCELQILHQNPKKFQGKVTWSLSEESHVTTLSETRDVTEHKITELKYGVYVIDDGDEDYIPSSEEESSGESELDDLDEEDY